MPEPNAQVSKPTPNQSKDLENRNARMSRSGAEFCAHYFPESHAAKTCGCYAQARPGVLVIQPRAGRSIRVL
jgi:hypothetical protein